MLINKRGEILTSDSQYIKNIKSTSHNAQKKANEEMEATRKEDKLLRQEYRKQMSSALGTALEGDENFVSLSAEGQDFLKNQVFGAVNVNPYKWDKNTQKNTSEEKTTEEISEHYG
jgi:hypothetical protein